MSGIDLSEATNAGHIARREAYFEGLRADDCTEAAILAAAPLIAEAIAQAIEAEMPHRDSAYRDGLVDATIIAREVTR